MPFKKGISGNSKGRPKGAKNRNTEQVRELLVKFVNSNLQNLQKEYDLLEGRDKLIFIDRLLKHVLPRPLHELEYLDEKQLDDLIKRLKNDSK